MTEYELENKLQNAINSLSDFSKEKEFIDSGIESIRSKIEECKKTLEVLEKEKFMKRREK